VNSSHDGWLSAASCLRSSSTIVIMIYDAIIIGGGVIGLSILRSALLAGYTAVLIERNADLCDGASGRNSGVLCTGVDAPSGSLERALIRDSISRVREFCGDHNVPMRECGSLVCLWPWDEDEDEKKSEWNFDVDENSSSSHARLMRVLHESHVAGDKDATFLASEEVAALEPSLSSKCRGAVHIPGETVVDPWLFCLALAVHSREMAEHYGTESDIIRTGKEAVIESSSFDANKGVWNIAIRGTPSTPTNNNADGVDGTATISARCVINAAGIDSDIVQSSASSASRNTICKLPPPTFEARPRRGQYKIFAAPTEGGGAFVDYNVVDSEWLRVPRTVPTRPIQQVPSQFTKGIFVYSTLYNQIVVGPTAQDQSSRADDTLDPNVARVLSSHASRVLGPEFNDSNILGEYVGIRPGTSERDYQIHLHCLANFITVGGIRSTGLTASLGIGRHVVQCLLPAVLPHAQRQLDGESSSMMRLSPTPLPNVKELVDQYHARGDGKVDVGGHTYRVTHPLTRLGWGARTGLAA